MEEEKLCEELQERHIHPGEGRHGSDNYFDSFSLSEIFTSKTFREEITATKYALFVAKGVN